MSAASQAVNNPEEMSKPELISVPEESHDHPDEDSTVTEARREIVGLLAVAYRRYSAIPKVGTDRPTNPVNSELANSSSSSVHGGVP
jgi:hypothetical protein